MTLNVTEDWLRAYCARTGMKYPEAAGTTKNKPGRKPLPQRTKGSSDGNEASEATPAKRSKYGNVRTKIDGITFDSKHEAERYCVLKLMLAAREIVGFARQFPFSLPGGVEYIADFVVFYADGHYVVEDAKSPATRMDKVYRLKKRLMKNCLGIEIQEV